MKPLTLKLKQKITYRIDMSFLSDAYKYKSIKHFMSKKIIYGNQEFKVSELFSVTGNQLNNIVIKSAIPLMDNIGYKQQGIRMNVYGNIGYSYSHISNNDWGKVNPGTDNQSISFSKKF